MELEEARLAGLSCYPPQAATAAACSMSKAKLLGLVIERAPVITGSPEQFVGVSDDEDEHQYQLVGRVEKTFRKFVRDIRKVEQKSRKASPPLIEHEAG
jgi:hypothetical protein